MKKNKLGEEKPAYVKQVRFVVEIYLIRCLKNLKNRLGPEKHTHVML